MEAQIYDFISHSKQLSPHLTGDKTMVEKVWNRESQGAGGRRRHGTWSRAQTGLGSPMPHSPPINSRAVFVHLISFHSQDDPEKTQVGPQAQEGGFQGGGWRLWSDTVKHTSLRCYIHRVTEEAEGQGCSRDKPLVPRFRVRTTAVQNPGDQAGLHISNRRNYSHLPAPFCPHGGT